MKKIIITLLLLSLVLSLASCGSTAGDTEDKSNITVMLDPGHGGSESSEKGAQGYDGTAEHTLNDSVCTYLAKELEERGYSVAFTRKPYEDEEEMNLTKRTNKVNEVMPDLLISVHHDAVENDPALISGYTIYYSSYKALLDSKDVFLEKKGGNGTYSFIREEIVDETTYVYYDVNGSERTTNSLKGDYIVYDETPCREAARSLDFANILKDKFTGLNYIAPINIYDDPVRNNDFRLLRISKVPSVLIEAGFVSNPVELEEIKKEKNQKAMAKAIADSVDEFFKGEDTKN